MDTHMIDKSIKAMASSSTPTLNPQVWTSFPQCLPVQPNLSPEDPLRITGIGVGWGETRHHWCARAFWHPPPGDRTHQLLSCRSWFSQLVVASCWSSHRYSLCLGSSPSSGSHLVSLDPLTLGKLDGPVVAPGARTQLRRAPPLSWCSGARPQLPGPFYSLMVTGCKTPSFRTWDSWNVLHFLLVC